jgi:hypothetical protein
MPRPVALLCLILALAGQPLRHAEAASDLARALAHRVADGDVIELPDGGVGDDSGVATLKAGACHVTDPARGTSCDLWTAVGLPLSLTLAAAPDLGATRRRQEQVPWLPVGARQRQAWLQLFLF